MAEPRAQRIAEDPVKVDPGHYQVEAENERVRVLRARYGPRERSIMHGHPDVLAVFLTDGHFRFTFPDGRTEERRQRAGEVMVMPSEEHLPENLSDQAAEVLVIELKR